MVMNEADTASTIDEAVLWALLVVWIYWGLNGMVFSFL